MRLKVRPGSFCSFFFLTLCALLIGFGGCVEELPTPVVFDQELKSVAFENRLFTPIVLFRDGTFLDTLQALETRTFPLNRRGIVRHSWQIVPPRGFSGKIAGISPYVDLGIQYDIEARYILTHKSVPQGTIFTPRIANFSPYDLVLYVNYTEADEFVTDYILPRNSITSDEHAPYYYWHSSSNIYLDPIGAAGYYEFSRQDTGQYRLELDSGPLYGDAGATTPITVR